MCYVWPVNIEQRQTMPNATANASPVAGPATRFAVARGYFIDRGVLNYQSVFKAVGSGFSNTELDRLRDLWNARTQVTDADVPLIERVETVVEILRAA